MEFFHLHSNDFGLRSDLPLSWALPCTVAQPLHGALLTELLSKNSLVKAVLEVRDLPYVAILDRQLTATACALSSDHDAEDVKTGCCK